MGSTRISNIGGGGGMSPATKVVATGSSGFLADYYTDGVDDDVQIQAAIDAAALVDGGVLIKNGTYSISTTINVSQNISILGEGIGTILKLATAGILLKFPDGDSGGHTLHIGISNIQFDGNTFSDSRAIDCGQYGQEFNIHDCWFRDWGTRHATANTSCIFAGGTNKKFTIMNNQFGMSGDYVGDLNHGIDTAIRLSTTGDVQIVGNIIVAFYNGIVGNTEKTQISGNDIYNGDNYGIFLGTVVSGLEIANIVGNTISDCVQGIRISETSGKGMNIVGNFFRNITTNAIWLRGAYHNIADNYFQNIATSGTGDDAVGISLNDGCTFVNVHHNNIYNSGSNMTYGIAIMDTADNGNRIQDNNITGYSVAPVRERGNNIISDNNMSSANGYLSGLTGVITDTASGAIRAAYIKPTFTPATNSSSTYTVLSADSIWNPAAGVTQAGITAVSGQNRVRGTGLITTAIGATATGMIVDSSSAATAQATSSFGVDARVYSRPSGSTTATIGTGVGYDTTSLAANAGLTVTTLAGFRMVNPAANTITSLVGLDVAALTRGATNIGVRIAAPSGGATANYALQLSDTAGIAAGGITFGADTTLYRSAANVLKSDDTFDANSYKVAGAAGVSGTFTTVDGKTVTVTSGIITSIV